MMYISVVFSKVFVFTFMTLAHLFYRSNLQDVYGTSKTNNVWILPIMPSNEDYNNERNANETRASSSLVETVILKTLSSNHLHASISSRRKKERIKVRKELSLLLPAEQQKLIHRNELPHKALAREHILSLLGASSLRSNDLERLISIKSCCVAENKKDVCGFAGIHVCHLMLEVAVDQKMLLNGCVVNSFRQLLHSWKYEQATPQQCETIFHITYGWFNPNRTWNYDMESKYLQLRNMMYMDEATDDFEQLDSNLKMGCIGCSIMRRSKKWPCLADSKSWCC